MLLSNAVIVLNSREVVRGSVLVRNNCVALVGSDESLRQEQVTERLDCGGRLLVPGLINCHDHFYGRSATGIALKDAPPKSFRDILERLWWKLDRALSEEAVYLSAKVCLIEAAEAGTTTVFDHHSSPNFVTGSLKAIARAVREVGLRANLCYETSERNGLLNAEEALRENVAFHQAIVSDKDLNGDNRFASKMGLHAAFTLSDELLSRCAANASVGCHVHVLEGPEDVGAVGRLSAANVLGKSSFLGHCVHVSDSDIRTIAASGSTVTIQVESNLNNRVGLPPIQKFLDANVRLVVGTDGMTQDMLQELRCLMLQFPSIGSKATQMLFDNAAQVASESFGVSLGCIEPKSRADFVLFDYVPATPLTPQNLPWHLQFGVKRVDSVWVDGRLVVRNGAICTVDKSATFASFRRIVEQVIWVSPELDRFPDVPAESVLFGRDFLRTWDFSRAELLQVLRTAKVIRSRHAGGLSCALLPRAGLALSVFRDKSTRTRLAYSSAAAILGLQSFVFDETVSQIAHGETTRETAVMTSLVTESVGIRDDLYLGIGEQYMKDFAAALKESHQSGGVFPHGCPRPTILNLQSDFDHPTQTLSDLLHLQALFGTVLRGKRVCVSWAYSPSYAKPLSVPGGLIALLPRFGVHVTLAHPAGFDLQPEVLEAAHRGAAEGGGAFRVVSSMAEGISGAHVVYAKSWGSMEFMRDRAAQFSGGKTSNNGEKETAALASWAALASDWEYNEEKRKLTSIGNALYMHCLPADISGENVAKGEVAKETFERDRLNMYRQASWKPYVCAAIVALQRSKTILFE